MDVDTDDSGDDSYTYESSDENYLNEVFGSSPVTSLSVDDSDIGSDDLYSPMYSDVEDDDSESDEMSLEEDDRLSEASTLLNEDHQQLSQSGTDTEVEDNQHPEDVVQTPKKIKLDEPKRESIEQPINDSVYEDQKCPICLEAWSNAGEHRLCCLRCGHLFGLKCITQWFNIAQNAAARKCPECNTKSSKKDIRVLYAKTLVCTDTSEIEKLKDQLKESCKKIENTERDIKQYRTKEIVYKQDLSNLRLRIQELEKIVKTITTENNKFHSKYENVSLSINKVFDVCNKGSCRVMAYNPWHKILVASFGNSISKIFMDNLMSCNYDIHSGVVRDLAFQEQHPNILLSVAFDKKIVLSDIRNNVVSHTYQEDNNLWSCCWSNYCNHTFFVGGARGITTEYDIRFLQSGVSVKENIEDRSPVVSLASVPTSSLALRAGGFLACQLNSCYAYSFKEGNYIGNRIYLEGPFISLRYNERDHHVLLSCRANSKNPYVRHIVCSVEKNDDCIQFNPVHSFNAGATQKLLSRPCYMNLKNDTIVAANNENSNNIVGWSISTGKETYSMPISEPVVDMCSFECNVLYQAVLTSNKLHIYHYKDQNT